MKTGTMRNAVFGAGLFLASMTVANAQVPIDDRDAFEKKYIECIMSGLKNKCFSTLVGTHMTPAAAKSEQSSGFRDGLQIIENPPNFYDSIYKIHPLDRIVKAGTWDSKTYLVEHSNGRISVAYINLLNIKEKWYVASFGFETSREAVGRFLKLPGGVLP
ncbi:MAG: hypothetical protein LBE06_07625 [Azoarcus sp.]|jgi:hypothetical protein|nr:hypothetical protein [Azoarcus sp.]